VNSDSTLVDHSTLSQQCLKSLSLKPLVKIWSSEDTPKLELHNSSGSIIRRRLSDHNDGRTNALKSKQMVPTRMLEWLKKSLQAGGKFSEMTTVTLWMPRTSWSGMLCTDTIVRRKISICGRSYLLDLSLRLRKLLGVIRF
jgi:hypothetical protein